MPDISDRIKRCLGSIAALQKDLSALDEDHDAITTLGRVLDGRRGELGEVEAQLARTRQEAREADAEYSKWRAATAKEQAAGNARIDELQGRLVELERLVEERKAQSENILQGIQALSKRLRVE